MDTNLLKVAGSSETACTLVMCDHLDSIRTIIPRLLAYCCLNAIQEWCLGFTTKGDDYNYHKVKLQLSPRETHWHTLLHLLVYTNISISGSFSVHYTAISAHFRINPLGPVLN